MKLAIQEIGTAVKPAIQEIGIVEMPGAQTGIVAMQTMVMQAMEIQTMVIGTTGADLVATEATILKIGLVQTAPILVAADRHRTRAHHRQLLTIPLRQAIHQRQAIPLRQVIHLRLVAAMEHLVEPHPLQVPAIHHPELRLQRAPTILRQEQCHQRDQAIRQAEAALRALDQHHPAKATTALGAVRPAKPVETERAQGVPIEHRRTKTDQNH